MTILLEVSQFDFKTQSTLKLNETGAVVRKKIEY